MSSESPQPVVSRKLVSFGNPALGTYKGTVYTIPHDEFQHSKSHTCTNPLIIEGAEAVNRMVAMTSVAPEHVPESILNLIRSHRPFIEHVRIVIVKASAAGDDESNVSLCENVNQMTKSDEKIERASIDVASVEKLGSVRVLSTGTVNQNSSLENDEERKNGKSYLVLFQLTSEADADMFVKDLNGQPFIAFDDQDTCCVEHVVALQGEDGVSLLNPHFAPSMDVVNKISVEASGVGKPTTRSAPSPGTVMEDQNCAVCLERLTLHPDDHATTKTAILSTVCNHTFHLDCLRQWSGPCIVCRFDHSGLNETLSQCHVCGTTEHNYVCLICGSISCVGPSVSSVRMTKDTVDCNINASGQREDDPGQTRQFYNSHAGQHYTATLHAYALDTQNQHVYDFAGQGYVHRLVQNKEDGKLVEISDPYSSSQERSLTPGLSDAQEGEVVHRKLEGFASQYYTLLKSQLEQQRTFYEGRLQALQREFTIKERNQEKSKADLIVALRQERKQQAQRLATIQRKKEKALNDAAFLKSMNESLEANKPGIEQRIQQTQRDRIASREMIQKFIPALEEKVTTLMLQLEESMGSGITILP